MNKAWRKKIELEIKSHQDTAFNSAIEIYNKANEIMLTEDQVKRLELLTEIGAEKTNACENIIASFALGSLLETLS